MAGKRKRKRAALFSVDSLREEIGQEINQEEKAKRILADIGNLDLHHVENVSEDVLYWALLFRFGLALVSSVAGIITDLRVLPSVSRQQVFKMLHPGISEDDGDVLFNCINRLSVDKIPASVQASDEVCVLSPPSDRCFSCNFHLVAHNNPVKAEYFNVRGSFTAVKVSSSATGAGFFMGTRSMEIRK